MSKETITSALGLSDEWYSDKVKDVRNNWDSHEKVSDVILSEAEDLRMQTLGEVNLKLSDYELKLVTLGYIIGLARADSQTNEMPMEIKELIAKIIKKKLDGDE